MLRSAFATIRTTLAALKERFDAFDGRLDAWAARHRPVLRVLGYALAFALLSGGMALHAFQTGFAQVATLQCGPACTAVPGIDTIAAIACGAGAILFVQLYARLTAAIQRVAFDQFKYVRPEPPPADVSRWAVMLHVLIGLVVFFTIAGIGNVHTPAPMDALFEMTTESPKGFRVSLGGYAALELILGWWIGGRGVLGLFWSRYRRATGFTLVRPGPQGGFERERR
jgi:hypothetical protein